MGRDGVAAAPAGTSRAILVALAVGFGLRLVGSWAPFPDAWGLDTLRHLPPPWAAGLALLGAIGFLPVVGPALGRASGRLGTAWERAGLRCDAALAAAAGALLFSFPDPTRFVGDADARVAPLFTAAPTSRVFPQATALDRLLNIEAPRALVRLGLDPELAARAMPALIGAMLILALLAFARASGAHRGQMVAVAALLLGSAIPIHMAGYGKFGLLLLGISLGALGALTMSREGRGALLLGVGAALAVLGHRSALLLVPAAFLALALGWRGVVAPAERRAILGAAAVLLLAIGIEVPHAWTTLRTIDRATHLGAFSVPGGIPSALWSALQILFYVAPSWLVGMVALWVTRSRASESAPRFGLAPVMWLTLVPAALQLLLLRGAQGEVRDWDMHLAPALSLGLLGACGLAAEERVSNPRTAAPLVTSAVASAVALWFIHADPLVSYARIDAQLERPALWTASERARTYDLLGMRAVTLGAPATAIRYLEAAVAIAPSPRYLSELGGALRMLGRPRDAAARYRQAMARDSGSADPWLGLGALALDRRDYAAALECARRARALAPDRLDARELERLAMAGSPGAPP